MNDLSRLSSHRDGKGDSFRRNGNSSFHPLPALHSSFLEGRECFVILETNRFDDRNRHSYLFFDPLEILESRLPEEIPSLLERLDGWSDSSFAAGFLTYEAGCALQGEGKTIPAPEEPLLWFARFAAPLIFDHRENRFLSAPPAGLLREEPPEGESPSRCADAGEEDVTDLRLSLERLPYEEKIRTIREHLAGGESYQVNFTTSCTFRTSLSPGALYEHLKEKQHVSYNAWIKRGEGHILSFSPELLFDREGERISSRPMKGTTGRGRTNQEDEERAAFLRSDPKNRSENSMIVDLVRNDLGSISRMGSVRVEELHRVEKYDTLFQMTSTVTSRLREGVPLSGIFRALFPSGSITGAPRRSTMRIIRALEEEPRGVYTGAIGFLAPGERARFNIPIRTVTLRGGEGRMGVGSGIVYDSDPGQEYEECLLKLRFLRERRPPFSLVESFRRQGGEYLRLREHLERLHESARYFDFPFPEEKILHRLAKLESSSPCEEDSARLRLLLNRQGEVELACSAENLSWPSPLRLLLSARVVESTSPFLFHKTTWRELYQKERALELGFHEVIFRNERGEITEGSISNLFVQEEQGYVTPPVNCGLLDGVYRREFIKRHRSEVREESVSVERLLSARGILLTNSVRGEGSVGYLEVEEEGGESRRREFSES